MKNAKSNTATIRINGTSFDVHKDVRVIDAVREAGIDLPGICYKPTAPGECSSVPGSCRTCQVEINGALATACEQSASPGMDIQTNSPKVQQAQEFALGMICAEHNWNCLDCSANTNCKLLQLAGRLQPMQASNSLYKRNMQSGAARASDQDAWAALNGSNLSPSSIEYDASLCIQCGRCTAVCPTGVIGFVGRGVDKRIAPPPGMDFGAACVNCGQCIKACPAGALFETSSIEYVEAALSDPTKRVVFQIAPAVRVALGEAFGLPPGERITGKIYAALRHLGVRLDSDNNPTKMKNGHNGSIAERPLATNVIVTDTNVAADLTIMEEATEIIQRINSGGKLPVITSCCPAWIKYMETYYPELSEHACTAKSPQQMMGALAKTYGAEVWGIDPQDMVNVSVMPCTAKKYEAQRPEMGANGIRDVDYVLTTREIARMFKARGLNPVLFEEEEADYPFEEYTGAATLFGNTGGVMEAAIRTVHQFVTGEELDGIEFSLVRGLNSVKEAFVDLQDLSLRVAVLHNLNGEHVKSFLDEILSESGDQKFAAIEIMACPGGCIGGGGQPKEFAWETKLKRTAGLNKDDCEQRFRRSHDSPVIKRIYENYLDEPNSPQAHSICHTNYQDRSNALLKEPEYEY